MDVPSAAVSGMNIVRVVTELSSRTFLAVSNDNRAVACSKSLWEALLLTWGGRPGAPRSRRAGRGGSVVCVVDVAA